MSAKRSKRGLRSLGAAVTVGALCLVSGCASEPGMTVDAVVNAGLSNEKARASCDTYYQDNFGERKGFSLVGALPSTLDYAKQLVASVGGDTSKDPNFGNVPASHAIVLCAVKGPLEQIGFKGSTLVYYVIPGLSSSGLAAVK